MKPKKPENTTVRKKYSPQFKEQVLQLAEKDNDHGKNQQLKNEKTMSISESTHVSGRGFFRFPLPGALVGILVALMGSAPSFADDALCGPGLSIEGNSGSSHIRLRPENLADRDAPNLQWAVDNIASGGTIELCEGTFHLGEGTEQRSVTIGKGVTLEGKKVNGDWLTVVEGGGRRYGKVPDPDIGPFLVSSASDPNPVKFSKVWLRKWLSEAVYVEGVNGFTFDDSKLTDPVVGIKSLRLLNKRFIHAIVGTGQSSKGEFIVTNNDVNLNGDWSQSYQPADVQFMGVYGLPKPAFSKIVVSGNKIVSPDEAIEILSNDAGMPASIFVEDNDINVNFSVGGGSVFSGDWFPGHYAILVTGNRNTPGVYIRRNRIVVANTMPAPGFLVSIGGDSMGAIAVNGSNFRVEDNTIHLDNLEGHAFVIGGYGKFPPFVLDVGTSLHDSVFRNNTLTGALKGDRALIKFRSDLTINHSRRNTFDITNSLNASVTVDSSGALALPVCGNNFTGDIRKIKGRAAKRCLFSSLPTRPTELCTDCDVQRKKGGGGSQ